MSKFMELKSALKTKKEWKEFIDELRENNVINTEGYMKITRAIRDSDLLED